MMSDGVTNSLGGITRFLERTRVRKLAGMAEAVESPSSEVEAIQFSADDMAPSPPRWTGRGAAAPMRMFFWWGYVQIPGRRPILLIRTITPIGTMIFHHEVGAGIWDSPKLRAGLRELYNGPSLYRAEAGDPNGWSTDPTTWHVSGSPTLLYKAAPKMVYEASSRYARIVEGNVLDTKWTYMPCALCINPGGAMGPYFSWPATAEGTYMGQPVSFTGGFDRMYGKGALDFLTKSPFVYLAFSGVGPDGQREGGAVFIIGDKSAGMYYKDGEDPVVSNQVELEAQYVANPQDAAQIVPAWATFRFGGKELTFVAQHQAIGARLGPLRILDQWGPWRERNSPPKFVSFLGTVESHIPTGSVPITAADKVTFPQNSPLL